MITSDKNLFHLKTGAYSYLFRVNEYGILEHLHFGAPLRTEDAEGFLCHSGLGWGRSRNWPPSAWMTGLWNGAAAAGAITGKVP